MNPRSRNWLVVFGSALALTVGNGPIMHFTFGVFLKPLAKEFGVDRGLTSIALMTGVIATALALPFAGRLADRVGPRTFGLTAASLFAFSIVAVGLFSWSIWSFMALFTVAGVLATGQTPLPYTRAVAACFDRRRGLALAIALTGVSIGTLAAPLVAQKLVGAFGWRGGYVGLGILVLLIAVPGILLSLPRRVASLAPEAVEAAGLTPAEAMRTRQFWLLGLGLLLAAAATNGAVGHVVPLLTDQGVSPAQAAGAMSIVGAASITGRLLGGALLDRLWAPLVALIFCIGLVTGILLLAFAPSPGTAAIAVLLLGLGLGVEADLVGFMTSRYLGLKAYGALFGLLFGVFVLASALGPVLMGVAYARTGSYVGCLVLLAVASAVAAVAFLALGPYAYPEGGKVDAAQPADGLVPADQRASA